MDRALCLYLLSNFATSNKKISMKTKMIVVVVLAAMCVLPLSAQVKVGVEGGMNLSHYLVSGSDGYKAEQVGGMKPGFQLGVTVDYEIGKHWMLMSGLSWLQNRSTMKMMDHMVTYFPKTEIKINNLILPLKWDIIFGFRINSASFRRLEFMLLTDLVLETVLWMLFTKRGII